MTPIDKSKLLAWTTRLVALRAAAKGTTKYEEALALKAELMERAEKREAERIKHLNKHTIWLEQKMTKPETNGLTEEPRKETE